MKKTKQPKDTNQRAKNILDLITGEKTDAKPVKEKNPAAVALGRLGGLKGGAARAKSLSAKKRKEIAKNAAEKRWEKKD